MSFFNAFEFIGNSRAGDAWFPAGLTTSFPNITASGDTVLSQRLPCKGAFAPGCKIFQVPPTNSMQAVELELDDAMADGLKDQVMVFQYQGKFHAVDHVSPVVFACIIDIRIEERCEERFHGIVLNNCRVVHILHSPFHGVRRLTLRILVSD